MKMYYGNTPIKGINVKHYEVSTSDATVKPSDVQAGVTYYAKGAKGTGTGKSFEFASYGGIESNVGVVIPNNINVIEISCLTYPIQHNIALSDMKDIDFGTVKTVGNIVDNGANYPITVKVENSELLISCSKSITFQVFYGKDNYVL